MSNIRSFFRAGHSLVVAIPKPLRDHMNIRKGDAAYVNAEGKDEISIKIIRKNVNSTTNKQES